MPADGEEVRDLLDEGNMILELASPRRICLADGKVVGLECVRNELGALGPDGRRRPLPVEGSVFTLEADTVILATGQRADRALFSRSALSLHDSGAIAVEARTGSAGVEGVYAGGDVARGPAIIVEACADGRRAAEAICEQLGVPFCPPSVPRPALHVEDLHRIQQARARKAHRAEPPILPLSQRRGFDLVEGTLSEEAAQHEAARCLQCAILCDKCVEVCPNRANRAYLTSPRVWELPILTCRDGALACVGTEAWSVRQERQIVHIDELCNECGNCATFCVHQGQPYLDKPRLFLTRKAFEHQANNAFYIAGGAIYRRKGGETMRLAPVEGGFTFEEEGFAVALGPDLAWRGGQLKVPFAGRASLVVAAEMAAILQGIASSLPFLVRTT
jgi:putative selenate reductase